MRAVIARGPAALRAIVFAAACAVTAPSAFGGAAPPTSCGLEGEDFMAFGAYDPMSDVPLDVQGRVSYRCSNHAVSSAAAAGARSDLGEVNVYGGQLVVQISIGAGNAGGFNRFMLGASDRLHYNLYLDPERQSVWGDGTGGTRVYVEHAKPNNKVVTVPVYGRIFGAQDVGAGGYLDQVIVTLDF